MKQILCYDWLLEWARLRVACFDPAQERNCVEQKNNVHDSWALLAMEMQKVAEDSQNTNLVGSLCHKHSWLSFPALRRNKSFLICVKAQNLCNIVDSLLTKLVWQRWLNISLVLFFHFYGPQLFLCQKKCKKKKPWPTFSHLDLMPHGMFREV